MTWYEILSTILAGVGILVTPLLVLMIRITVRWIRTESTLTALVQEVKDNADVSERNREVMYEQMRIDRDATNQRLYYLEKIWIERGLKGR